MPQIGASWVQTHLTDEKLLEIFHLAAKTLSGLTAHAHPAWKATVFTNSSGHVSHIVTHAGRDWACHCPAAIDGECAASVYSRILHLDGF